VSAPLHPAEDARPVPGALSALADEYLRVLANERGASAHTLRAYRRELGGFAGHIAAQYGAAFGIERIEHTHIRAYLGTLYDRGLTKASAEASKAPAPRALHRADEPRGRFGG